MKTFKSPWSFTLIFFFILSLTLNASALEQKFSVEKFNTEKVNEEKYSEEKITTKTVVEDGHVSGLPYRFGEGTERHEGTAAVDIPFLPFDNSVYPELLDQVQVVDTNGYPRMTNTYHKYTKDDPDDNLEKVVNSGMHCPPEEGATGYFILYFEEQELNDGQGNGEGYDHPEYGEARREAACEAFKEIARIVEINGNPEVGFLQNPANTGGTPLPSGALAGAITFFPVGNGFHGGQVWEHATTGVDPEPGMGNFDAVVITNLYNNVPWSTDNISGSSFDLFTVLLHEGIHSLGFSSRIPSVITQEEINGQNLGNPYTNFDKYLYATDQSTLPLISPDTQPFMNNPFTGSTGAPPAEMSSNQSVFKADALAVDQARPVYSPAVWQDGSSMSHFDMNRAPGTEYIMHPAISRDETRSIHAHEKEALCRIGYSLRDFDCGNQPPVAVDDEGYSTDVGTEICVNFRDSADDDYDPEDDPFWLNSLDVALGGNAGSLSYWDAGRTTQLDINDQAPQIAVICYTPDINFQGTALLYYTLSDGNNSESNVAQILIDFVSDLCIDDPTNYICNGGFEQGPSPESSVLTMAGSNIPFWSSVTNSPDILRREYTETTPFLAFVWRGPNTHNGTPNDRYYSGFVQPDYGEAAYTHLIKPLDPTKEYALSFYHHRGVATSSGVILTPEVYLSETPPSYSNATDYEPTGTDQTLYSTTDQIPNGWQQYSTVFSPASEDHRYLIIKSRGLNFTGYALPFAGFDDVAIRDLGVTPPEDRLVDIKIDKASDKSAPEVGEVLTYTIRVQNLGDDMATDIQVTDYLPADVTHISHSLTGFTNGLNATVTLDEYNNGIVFWVIDKLAGMEWLDLNVTVAIDASAQCQTLRNVAIVTGINELDISTLNDYVDPNAPGFPFTSEADNYEGKVDTHVLCSGDISGLVYHDLNENGQREANEPGLDSIQIELYKNENGQPVLPAVSATFSSADLSNYGTYEFPNLAPGTYSVKLNHNAEWQKTAPPAGPVAILGDDQLYHVVVDNDAHPDKNFGLSYDMADIEVLKSADVTSTSIGGFITYTIRIINHGPGDTRGVLVKDDLEEGLSSSSYTLNGSQAYFFESSGSLNIPELMAGDSVTLKWTVLVNDDLCEKETVPNRATLQGSSLFDPNSNNNTSKVDVRLRGCPKFDIQIKKDVARIQDLGIYQYVTYAVLAVNLGPDTAQDISIKDLLPENGGYISHQTSDGSAQLNFFNNELDWGIPQLNPGQIGKLSVTIKRLKTSPLTNTARLEDFTGVDINDQNNATTHFLPPAN